MKKIIKVLLIICISCFIIGLAIALGSYFYFYKDKDVAEKSGSSEVITEEVKVIEARLTNCNVTFEEGSEFSYRAKNVYGPGFSVDVNDGKLTLNYKNSENFTLLGWQIGNDASLFLDNPPEVIVTLPADTDLWSVFMEVGTGNIQINSLDTENLVIQLGAGDIELSKVSASVNSEIQLGTGNLDLGDSVFEAMYASVGAGNISSSFGQSFIDYDLDLSTGLGVINYPGSSGVITSFSDRADRKYELKADVGVGSINLD